MDWKNIPVLVTGAGGFIGSHLTETLTGLGARVTAFVHYNSRNDIGQLAHLPPETLDRLTIASGDITDFDSIEAQMRNVEYVFHLAALIAIPYSYRAPTSYVMTNVLGTSNVIRAGLRQGVKKIVHTSTSEVYGTARYTPIDENHPLQGQSPYSASKIGADKIAESFHCAFNAPVATIRPFNTYGPRQSTRAVIPTIITQLLFRDRVRLGSLTPIRDFTFVHDTVAGFLAVAASERTVGQVVNVGSGSAVTIGQLYEKLAEITGERKPLDLEAERVRPENSEVMQLLCDPRRAGELAGWAGRTSLDEGLRRTVEFIAAHPEQYRAVGRYTL